MIESWHLSIQARLQVSGQAHPATRRTSAQRLSLTHRCKSTHPISSASSAVPPEGLCGVPGGFPRPVQGSTSMVPLLARLHPPEGLAGANPTLCTSIYRLWIKTLQIVRVHLPFWTYKQLLKLLKGLSIHMDIHGVYHSCSFSTCCHPWQWCAYRRHPSSCCQCHNKCRGSDCAQQERRYFHHLPCACMMHI